MIWPISYGQQFRILNHLVHMCENFVCIKAQCILYAARFQKHWACYEKDYEVNNKKLKYELENRQTFIKGNQTTSV